MSIKSQREVCSEQCTVYSVQCTAYSVQCTVYSVTYSSISVHPTPSWKLWKPSWQGQEKEPIELTQSVRSPHTASLGDSGSVTVHHVVEVPQVAQVFFCD